MFFLWQSMVVQHEITLMQLMGKCKGVTNVSECSHDIGWVLKILVFSFKTRCPMINHGPIPAEMWVNNYSTRHK